MMDVLQHTSKQSDGIFGDWTIDGDSSPFMVTAEHAYLQPDEMSYDALLQPGIYTCQRGTHQLIHGGPFETFEILGVVDAQGNPHSGVLVHPGNFPQKDSEGCVLAGKAEVVYDGNGDEMITTSNVTFMNWMMRKNGIDSFQLQVI
jgi:hypothetical protein